MGTRHLIKVKTGNKTKIAQYGQWDGGPNGQGRDIAKFIHNYMDLAKFKKQVAKLKWATAKEIKATWTAVGVPENQDYVNMDQAKKHSKLYPQFSRDTCADILGLIHAGKIKVHGLADFAGDAYIREVSHLSGYDVKTVENQGAFAKDKLFCEYVYEIDLDKKIVDMYCGSIKLRYTFAEFTVEAMDALENALYNENESQGEIDFKKLCKTFSPKRKLTKTTKKSNVIKLKLKA